MTKKPSRPQTTNDKFNPGMSYAWGAAAQIDMISQADDPDLWEKFFAFLRERNLFNELADRINLEADQTPPEAAQYIEALERSETNT